MSGRIHSGKLHAPQCDSVSPDDHRILILEIHNKNGYPLYIGMKSDMKEYTLYITLFYSQIPERLRGMAEVRSTPKLQHSKSATLQKCNIPKVQHSKFTRFQKCNIPKVLLANKTTCQKCNMPKVQHAKSATCQKCNIAKVQYSKSATCQ